MKYNKKIYAVNRQEDEDGETYTLHPENAMGNIRHEKASTSNNAKQEVMKYSKAKNQALNLYAKK